jgi:hypothetical protein
VDADALEARVQAARARGLDASQEAIAHGVCGHIQKARDAAFRIDPMPRRLSNWWRGTLVEAAHRNLHAGWVQMVDLLDENEVQAEIPAAVARAEAALPRDDPRQISIEDLRAQPVEQLRPLLRRLMGDSYQALDGKHAQLRSFRNILILTAFVVAALVGVTVVVVSLNPQWIPLCFPNEVTTGTEPNVTEVRGQNCPTSTGATGPSGSDVLIVALLGALGGALAAAVSIRNLKGTSTAYDVPVALAGLKVPLGAFTAILALVAIRGDFIPGLSVLDSQEQILAYALIFGFAQQLLTRLLDQRAQTLLEGLPGGTGVEPARPSPRARTRPAAPGPAEADGQAREEQAKGAPPAADLPFEDVEVISSDEPAVEPATDEPPPAAAVAPDEVVEPDPLTDQGDEVQDDEIPVEEISQDDQARPPGSSRRG